MSELKYVWTNSAGPQISAMMTTTRVTVNIKSQFTNYHHRMAFYNDQDTIYMKCWHYVYLINLVMASL